MPKVPKTHADFHYSVTMQTDDLTLLGCLRAISAEVQTVGNNRIPWGGTKQSDWIRDKNEVRFHFSEPAFRDAFISETERFLPRSLWRETSRSDSISAVPQS